MVTPTIARIIGFPFATGIRTSPTRISRRCRRWKRGCRYCTLSADPAELPHNGDTMKSIALAILAAAAALPAGEPEGFKVWKAAELKSTDQKLAGKLNAQKVATDAMGTFGNHLFMLAHREGNGEAELHEKVADVFVAREGEATLIVGGSMVDGKTTAPGEVRGPSIKGGVSRILSPGDVIHIQANSAH